MPVTPEHLRAGRISAPRRTLMCEVCVRVVCAPRLPRRAGPPADREDRTKDAPDARAVHRVRAERSGGAGAAPPHTHYHSMKTSRTLTGTGHTQPPWTWGDIAAAINDDQLKTLHKQHKAS